MSNDTDNDDRLASRQQRMNAGGKSANPLIMGLFLVGLTAAGGFLVFPDQIKNALGLGTSEAEKIQVTSQTDSTGLSTNLRPRRGVDTDQKKEPEIVIAPVERSEPEVPPTPDRSAELEKQIEELQAQIAELLNRPEPVAQTDSGISAEDLQKALEEQSKKDREAAAAREELLRAEMEARLASMRVPVPGTPTGPDLAEEERLRRLKELEERRLARLKELEDRRLSDANIYDESVEGVTSGASDQASGVQDLSANQRFLNRNANAEVNTARARDLGDLSRTIVQGTIITAILETAVNTELPGSMRAVVSSPVYSYDGMEVLLPSGTRLIGAYNDDVSLAQSRVLIAWNRAITPEGKSISLAGSGIDRLGRGGVEGNVDTRFVQRFGTAALITTIAAIPAFVSSVASENNGTSQAATTLGSDVSKDFGDQTKSVLEDYLKLPPVIRLPQGYEVKVFVNQDLVF